MKVTHFVTFLLSFFLWTLGGSPITHADMLDVKVIDKSTSGKTVRISLGQITGLSESDPVLFRKDGVDVAFGRVLKIDDRGTVISLKDNQESALGLDYYTMIFGVPLLTAPNLPDYITDRAAMPDHPKNEKFFTPDGAELQPELDQERYTPEVVLRPNLPEAKLYSPHGITVGLGLFRNRALATTASTDTTKLKTYTGYSFRYGYTFPTYMWLREAMRALISTEVSLGVYNFSHTFPDGTKTQVRVYPISFQLRYQAEISKMFRLYPYVGYQNNIAGATKLGSNFGIEPVKGGRLMGGAGGQLVMNETMDARLEVGSDGLHTGLMWKF